MQFNGSISSASDIALWHLSERPDLVIDKRAVLEQAKKEQENKDKGSKDAGTGVDRYSVVYRKDPVPTLSIPVYGGVLVATVGDHILRLGQSFYVVSDEDYSENWASLALDEGESHV